MRVKVYNVERFSHPEVILYDAVPGGAGYSQTLLKLCSMHEILTAACGALLMNAVTPAVTVFGVTITSFIGTS